MVCARILTAVCPENNHGACYGSIRNALFHVFTFLCSGSPG